MTPIPKKDAQRHSEQLKSCSDATLELRACLGGDRWEKRGRNVVGGLMEHDFYFPIVYLK